MRGKRKVRCKDLRSCSVCAGGFSGITIGPYSVRVWLTSYTCSSSLLALKVDFITRLKPPFYVSKGLKMMFRTAKSAEKL